MALIIRLAYLLLRFKTRQALARAEAALREADEILLRAKGVAIFKPKRKH